MSSREKARTSRSSEGWHPRRGARGGGGRVAGVRTPVCYQRPGCLDSMRVEAVLKARSNPLGPTSAEEVILVYKRVQGGFEGTSVRKDAAKEESDDLNERREVLPADRSPGNEPLCEAFSSSLELLRSVRSVFTMGYTQ
jgi:hypothetical protein